MAQFDVFQTQNLEILVDCQSDLLDHLSTRFVVPLLPPDAGISQANRFNPAFEIGDDRVILYPQFSASVPATELGKKIASLAHERDRIVRAVDMLVMGI